MNFFIAPAMRPHNAGFVVVAILNNRCFTMTYYSATEREVVLINLSNGEVLEIKRECKPTKR